MRLTVLGCAGTFPGPGNPCSGYLFEADGYRLLVDAGNGSTGTLQSFCSLLEIDAILITHLHGDHYLDLVTYTYARRYHPDGPVPPVPTYAPQGLSSALSGRFAKHSDPGLSKVYDLRDLSARPVELGPFEVRPRRVNHPVETYGLRITHGPATVAYSADTAECQALVELAEGVDALLCEASYLDGDDNPPDVHLTGRQAGEHARRAGAARLLLTHLVPWGDPDRTLAAAAEAFGEDTELVRPGSVYEFSQEETT